MQAIQRREGGQGEGGCNPELMLKQQGGRKVGSLTRPHRKLGYRAPVSQQR